MWGLGILNLRPLASLVWEENEVTDAHVMSCRISVQNFYTPLFASGEIKNEALIFLFLSSFQNKSNGAESFS